MGCLTMFFAAIIGFFFWGFTDTPAPSVSQSDELDLQQYADLPQTRTEDGAFVLGYDDAPVTLIIFEDFFCPHCQNLRPTVDEIIQTYVSAGAVRYEFRFLATAGGETLNDVARILECSAHQRTGAFWEGYLLTYHLTINGGFPSRLTDAVDLYAQRLDLSQDDLLECMETAEQFATDAELAAVLGVQGTPGIFILDADGNLYPASTERTFDALSRLIEQAKYGIPTGDEL